MAYVDIETGERKTARDHYSHAAEGLRMFVCGTVMLGVCGLRALAGKAGKAWKGWKNGKGAEATVDAE